MVRTNLDFAIYLLYLFVVFGWMSVGYERTRRERAIKYIGCALATVAYACYAFLV